MTVSSSFADTRYAGDGSSVDFATGFAFYATSTLRVSFVDNTTGAETVKSLSTHYTVTGGNGATGSIHFLTAPPSGVTVVFKRNEPYTQGTDLGPNDPLPAEVLELTYDKLEMQIQQLLRLSQLSIQAGPPFDPNMQSPYLMPAPEADMVLIGRQDELGWENGSLGDLSTSIDTIFTSLLEGDILRYDGDVWRNAQVSTIINPLFSAKGDLLTAAAAETSTVLPVGTNGSIPMARSAAAAGLAYVSPFKSLIYGWTYQNAADAVNDINIAAGGGMDETGVYWIETVATVKQLDAAWAVGVAQGGRDTGSIADGDWYIFAIARSDTGVADVIFSLSPTAPTMPTSYDFKRRLGWFQRASATIVAFRTYESDGGSLDYMWPDRLNDIDTTSLSMTRVLSSGLRVPKDFSTVATINVEVDQLTDGGTEMGVNISNPDETNAAVVVGTAPIASAGGRVVIALSGGDQDVANVSSSTFQSQTVRTSATGQIALRASELLQHVIVSTVGFHWSRR